MTCQTFTCFQSYIHGRACFQDQFQVLITASRSLALQRFTFNCTTQYNCPSSTVKFLTDFEYNVVFKTFNLNADFQFKNIVNLKTNFQFQFRNHWVVGWMEGRWASWLLTVVSGVWEEKFPFTPIETPFLARRNSIWDLYKSEGSCGVSPPFSNCDGSTLRCRNARQVNEILLEYTTRFFISMTNERHNELCSSSDWGMFRRVLRHYMLYSTFPTIRIENGFWLTNTLPR